MKEFFIIVRYNTIDETVWYYNKGSYYTRDQPNWRSNKSHATEYDTYQEAVDVIKEEGIRGCWYSIEKYSRVNN